MYIQITNAIKYQLICTHYNQHEDQLWTNIINVNN